MRNSRSSLFFSTSQFLDWKLLVLYLNIAVLLQEACGGYGMILPPVYWSEQNPIFKTSNNDHVVEVNVFDQIDIICPYRRDEYYVVYQVNKRYYENCEVPSQEVIDANYERPRHLRAQPEPIRTLLVNCSTPHYDKEFTLIINPFPAAPGMVQFSPGQKYYFITTSSGKKEGMSLEYGGACKYKNMKMVFNVLPVRPIQSTPSQRPHVATPTRPTQRTVTTPKRSTVEEPSTTTTTTTTTTSTTTTTTTPKPKPRTEKPPQKTPKWRFTKPRFIPTKPPKVKPDKEKPKDKNVVTYPKHSGLVNSAGELRPSAALFRFLLLWTTFLSYFHWRR